MTQRILRVAFEIGVIVVPVIVIAGIIAFALNLRDDSTDWYPRLLLMAGLVLFVIGFFSLPGATSTAPAGRRFIGQRMGSSGSSSPETFTGGLTFGGQMVLSGGCLLVLAVMFFSRG